MRKAATWLLWAWFALTVTALVLAVASSVPGGDEVGSQVLPSEGMWQSLQRTLRLRNGPRG